MVVPFTSRYAHANDSQPTSDLVFERSAGWESLILPGLTAIRGDWEGGEKTVPEDVVGAMLRFVRGNEEFSRPLACFSFSALFLFQKRKSAKTRG